VSRLEEEGIELKTISTMGRKPRTGKSWWAKWLTGLAVVGILVTACGGSTASPSASPSASTSGSAAPSSPSPTEAVTPAPTENTSGEVPRNQTLITGSPGPKADNIWSPLLGGINPPSRASWGLWEALFYTNLNTGELIPWQAEGFTMNADYTQVTLNLRDGVTWCDGQKFTADDVKFTYDALVAGASSTPPLYNAATYAEYVKNVTVVDPLTVTIDLKKPAPRWFHDQFTIGHENHYAIVPKHIYEGQDFTTYADFDVANGLPCTTGPYHITSSTADKLVMDRNAKWWASDTGFANVPAPARIIYIPIADEQACANLYITNEIDVCGDLQPGLLVSTMQANPEVRAWAKEGPIWGAPDGCGYNFAYNTTVAPYDDVNVRLALNYAFDRQQITDLAYEGSNRPQIIAFSSYMSAKWQPGRVQAVLDKYDRGTHSQAKVDDYMGKAGFEKNADGFWAKDGTVLTIDAPLLGFMKPIGPVIQQQLIAAGFDATTKVVTDLNYSKGVQPTWIVVHCSSLTDPFEAYTPYHSKWATPAGTDCGLWMGCSRWKNAEMDQLLDNMEAVPADASQDGPYMDWVVRATEIYLEEMPEIMLTEELHPVTMNLHYWTGYMTAEDPYIAPYYCCWSATNLMLQNLQPTGAQ
jgi:peptide/nickel transport system substrate-binding protein